MKSKKRGYEFSVDVSDKAWKPPIDAKIWAYRIGKKIFRLSYPVYAAKGSEVFARPGEGIVVDGKLFPRKGRPWKATTCIIGWVPKHLKIAVFLERGRLWAPGKKDHGKATSGWIAADIRGYNVSQGDDPIEAVKSLLRTCSFSNEMAEQERRKGLKVIRRMLHRKTDVKREMKEMEEKARKGGLLIDGVLVPPTKILEAGFGKKRKRA